MILDHLSYRALQWLVFLFLVLHNLEEGVTARAYFPKIKTLLAGLAPPGLLVSLPTLKQFYIALIGGTIFPLLIIAIAATGRPSRIKVYLVAVVQAMLLVNVFVPHVPAAIALGGYAPGVVTATLVNLPFSIYFFQRSLRESQITWKGLALAMAIALPSLLLSIRLLYALGGSIAGQGSRGE
jgi:hypothetical protein